MHSPSYRTSSHLTPNFPGSLRASAKLIASTSSTALTPFTGHHRRPPPPVRALPPLPEESLTRPESWADEFEQISYDEFRRTLLLADPSFAFPATDYQAQPSIFSRSRDSLRKLSRLSFKRPRRASEHSRAPSPSNTHLSPRAERAQFVSASPPPSVSPTSRGRSSTETAPVEDTSSAFYDEDPFRKAESPSEYEFTEFHTSLQAVLERPNPDHDPRRDVAPYSSSSTLISDQNSTRSIKPLKRLKSLSKLHLFGSRKSINTDRQTPLPRASSPRSVVAEIVTDYLPELSFEHFDCAPVVEEEEEELQPPPAVPPKDPPSPLQTIQQIEPQLSKYISHLQVYRYERVDPRDLTASVRTSTVIGYSPVASPLPPPSPSWLSRNVKDLEFYAEREASLQATPLSPDPIPIPPPSPRPLPILPRSLLPVRSRTSLAESQSCADNCPNVPESPRSTSSSVTLFVRSNAASPVRSSFYARSCPPSAATNRFSVIHYRQSLTDAGNAHFLFALSSLAPGAATSQRSSLNALFSCDASTGPQEPLCPAADSQPLYSAHAPPALPESSDARSLQPAASAQKPPKPSLRIFIPNQPPPQDLHSAPDQLRIPAHLLAAIRDPSLISAMNTAYNKPNDTVDWGDDYDYSGYEWFKDPPPRPEPAPTPRAPEMPDQAAMHQNAMFDFALKSAPNVLYAKYKQYGQLGVLAWSSEFSEMIDALKVLGFEGNMFVATRTQALRTCEEIIKLLKSNLKVDMQIIVLYLCSQVIRLRRFLDSDHQWNDYPVTTFPMDPYKHGAD